MKGQAHLCGVIWEETNVLYYYYYTITITITIYYYYYYYWIPAENIGGLKIQ